MSRSWILAVLAAVAACGGGDDESPTGAADAGGAVIDAAPSVDTTIAPADAAPQPDAVPSADAPPTGALERLDYRTGRGAPLATSERTVPLAELFRVAGDGAFLLRSDCTRDGGCTLAWYDAAGTETRRRKGLAGVTAGSVSPGADAALYVALDEDIGTCDSVDPPGLFRVARGVLTLLDLDTGAARFELRLRTNLWSAPAFTSDGALFFAAPIPGDLCVGGFELHSVAPPFGLPPGLDDSMAFIAQMDAHHWLVWRNRLTYGVVDPTRADSFVPIVDSDNGDDTSTSAGWTHVYTGYSNLAEVIVSLSPDGQIKRTETRDEDWFPMEAAGRWVRVCGHLREDPWHLCRVVDTAGQVPARTFRVTHDDDHRDDGVLLLGGAMIFIGPDDDEARAVWRLDLATGRRDRLHDGAGAVLRPLGAGGAALLTDAAGTVWLIEADHDEKLAEGVTAIQTMPDFPSRRPVRQDDLAVLILGRPDDKAALTVVDLRSRRLAVLSDDIFYTSNVDPFVGDCGLPWTTRTAGFPGEGLTQDARSVFFVEQGSPAALWIVPIDLSTPPRRLAELPIGAPWCSAPLEAAGGERLGFSAPNPDGETARVVVSSEP